MSSNKRLKELLTTYTKTYQIACEKSRQREVAMLIPGKAQAIPKEGIIYGKDNREKFSQDCKKIRDEALSILDAEAGKIEKKLKEPPSAEAVNSIRLLSMRGKSITQGDIDRLIDAYGDNHQAFKTIKSIANEKGIRVKAKDRTEEKLRAIEGLKRTIAVEVGLAGAERGRATTGFCSFLESEIDLIINE